MLVWASLVCIYLLRNMAKYKNGYSTMHVINIHDNYSYSNFRCTIHVYIHIFVQIILSINMVNNKYGKCLFSVDSRAAPPTATRSVAVDGKCC